MSRLSDGEREFVSGFGELPQHGPQPATPIPPPPTDGVREIDARRLAAPLPLLKAHRALRSMRPGEELRVIAGYEGSMAEFQALAKHDISLELLSQDAREDVFLHLLRKRR